MGIPTYLNPFKSRTPTTKLGRVGKALNPLNPFNARAILIEEAIRAVAGKYLPADTQRRLEYFSFGPQVGVLANILDAGTVNAQDDQKLIQESERIRRGMQRQKEIESLSNMTKEELKENIIKIQESIIPKLKSTLNESTDSSVQSKIEQTIQKIKNSPIDKYNLYQLRKLNQGL